MRRVGRRAATAVASWAAHHRGTPYPHRGTVRMNCDACGVSPIAARTSATRLCRLASDTKVPGQRLSRRSSFDINFRSTIEQDLQQSKRPGRKRDWPAMAKQHMTHGIELAGSKGDTHVSAKKLGFRENSERTTQPTPAILPQGENHDVASDNARSLMLCLCASCLESKEPRNQPVERRPRRPARRSGSGDIRRSRST